MATINADLIYQQFTDWRSKHFCKQCDDAHGKEAMCPAGRGRYQAMLDELDQCIREAAAAVRKARHPNE